MNIAILGGSFNPPHIGHFIVAQQVLELEKLDEVWLMPLYNHPFQKTIETAEHRLNMTKFMQTKRILVSDYEVNSKKINYTYYSLTELSKLHPENNFSLIIGSDQLDNLGKWKDIEKLINSHKIFVFPRHNDNDKSKSFYEKKIISQFGKLHENIIILDNKNLVQSNISSSEIRDRVRTNKSIRYLVDEKIEKYISENKIYHEGN